VQENLELPRPVCSPAQSRCPPVQAVIRPGDGPIAIRAPERKLAKRVPRMGTFDVCLRARRHALCFDEHFVTHDMHSLHAEHSFSPVAEVLAQPYQT
jgi:hypothetical protein